MKKKNIFQNQSQEILNLFEDANDRTKVMCIPMDYAKKNHLVNYKTLKLRYGEENQIYSIKILQESGCDYSLSDPAKDLILKI